MFLGLGLGLSGQRRARARSVTFNFTSALPAEFSYSRADTVATYINSSGKMVTAASNTPRFNHTSTGIPLGMLREPTRQNKHTNTNANPTTTTGLSTSGDVAGVLSVVNDAAGLASAGLDQICTNGNVFLANNSAGSTNFTVTISGQAGNTNAHSFSAYIKTVGGTVAMSLTSGAGSVTLGSSSGYSRINSENVTVDVSTRTVRFVVTAGRQLYFILNQFEEGAFSTTPIIVAGSAATRQPELLRDTSITSRSYFNAEEGAVVADFTLSNITNSNTQHLIFIGKDGTLDDCMSTYMLAPATRTKISSRMYVDTNIQTITENNGVDKAGSGATARFPSAITWRNGSEITALAGPSFYQTCVPSGTIDAIARLDIGGRGSNELLYGHVRSVKIYKKYRTVEQIGRDMVKAGEFAVLFTGQSNATGPFDSSDGSLNGGEKAGTVLLDTVWPNTRNWLVNGALEGTTVRYLSGQTADDYWINEDTGQLGNPFLRCLKIVEGARNATFKGIINISDESDAGNGTQADYIDAQQQKFTILRNRIGNVPVILVPIGRNTSSDLATYQTMREWQRALVAANPSYIYMAPERFDLGMADIIHLSDASNQTMMQRALRKLMRVLGETVTGPVDGPSISAVSRSGTTVTVTLTHPSGITDFTPTSAIEGFVFLDNTTPVTISSAVRTNATTITLTLSGTPSNASQTLYYGRNSLSTVTVANLVRGNDANTLPLQSAKFVSSNTGASFAAGM